MNVLVLGAGIIGTTSAYFLAKQGHNVTVVDRQKSVAMLKRLCKDEERFVQLILLTLSSDPWGSVLQSIALCKEVPLT